MTTKNRAATKATKSPKRTPPKRAAKPAPAAAASGVYFVQAGAGGLIKIGRALRLRHRVRDLRRMNGAPLIVLGYVAGADRERGLHMRFARDRAHGEWFRASAPLLRFITASATRPIPAPEDT